MFNQTQVFVRPLLAVAVFSAPVWGFAQTAASELNPPSSESTATDLATHDSARYSWVPFTSHGYLGATLGKPKFDIDCASGWSCERNNTVFNFFTGGKLRDVIGFELRYLEMGEAARPGGAIRARGGNLSELGNLPTRNLFSIFGRVGRTFGWSNTDFRTPSLPSGKDRGFGLGFGGGINFELAANWGFRAEWERHRFEVVNEKSAVDLYSIGFNYRF